MASRIVSLCPSTTESLIELGCQDQLVGISRFCIHPADRVANVEKVGGTKDPKIDRIVALEPDLVLLNEEENRREDHDALVARGLRVETAFPRRVAEVPDHLRWLGQCVGRTEAAESWAIAIESLLRSLENPPPRRFRYLYLIWKKPWMAAGPDTYVDDLMRIAGGENEARFGDSPPRYPTLDLDAVGPVDVVLLPDEPFPFAPKHLSEVRAAFPRSQHFELISGDDACWHGIRTLRGLELARHLRARFA